MLCQKGIVLKNGHVDMTGDVTECVDHYLISSAQKDIVSFVKDVSPFREEYKFLTHSVDFIEVEMLNQNPGAIATDEPLQFRVRLKCSHADTKFQICVFFINTAGIRVLFCMTDEIFVPKGKEIFDVCIKIPYHSLPRGRYSVRFETNLQHFDTGSIHFDFIADALSFYVKYVHADRKDEYLFWNANFGETLQIEERIPIRICL